MKKYVKFLLGIFVFLCFNSSVYASDQCFYMPGKNNTTIIPKGYSARCYYEYSPTKSNNGGSKKYQHIALSFKRSLVDGKYVERIYVSGADEFDDLKKDILYLDENLQPFISNDVINSLRSDSEYFDFDGLKIYKGSYFSKSTFDANVNGCPKSFYWIDDNTSANEYKIGFSSTENPSFSFKSGGKYAVYNYVNSYVDDSDGAVLEVYDDIMLIADSSKNSDISYPRTYDKATYDKLIKECDPNTTTGNQSGGYGDQNEIITNDKVETIGSCSYYFELKNHYKDANNTCYAPKVTFTFQKKTISGKSSLSVTTDLKGLRISNIQDKINLVDLDNKDTYSNLSDYLVYKNGKWVCADKIYIYDSSVNDLTVFGQSRYNDYNVSYGVDQIAESKSSNVDLCPITDKDDSDNNGGINWDDDAEVNCEGIIGDELLDFINKIFRWIQIIAPILVIILGSVDFAGSMLKDDKDALQKATSKFIKRLLVAIALFLIPVILNFVLEIFNEISISNTGTCGIGE